MSLIEEYFELNEAEDVSSAWKIFTILLYGIAAAFGLACGYTMALLRMNFDDKCYLFTVQKKGEHVNWENDSWCDFYQFGMVSSFIVAIIWGAFFLMCGRGGKSLTGLPQPWRIVWPSLVFNFIFLVITLFCASNIQNGTDVFCQNEKGKKHQFKTTVNTCGILSEIHVTADPHTLSIEIDVVVKTAWVCACCWIAIFIVSLVRIVLVIDFNLYKVCVFKLDDTIQNKKEEVLRITNYEEPKKLYNGDEENQIFDPGMTDRDSEVAEKRRLKPDKKLVRQHFNISRRLPHKPNAIFYETADIRMLAREKKSLKTTSKALKEAFGKSAPNLGFGLPFGTLTRKTGTKLQSESHAATNFELPSFLHQYNADLYYEDEDDDDDNDDENDDSSSSTPLQKLENSNESESGTDVHDSNRSLTFKKRI